MAEPRGQIEVEPEETSPSRPPTRKKGARASIQVSDIELEGQKAADVLDAASGGGGRRSRDAGGNVSERQAAQRFSRAVKDPNNKIIAARSSPSALPDGTALGDTMEIATHEGQSEEEIKRDIAEARGGKKWIVRVYSPEDQIIASKSVMVGGVPKMDPMLDVDLTPEEDPQMEQGQELSDEELLEQTLARDPEIIKARKNLRLMQLKNEQEEEEAKAAELRARRVAAERAIKGEATGNGNGNGNGKHHEDDEDDRLLKAIDAANAPLKEANAALQRRLEDAEKRNAEKESRAERRQELDAMMAPLKTAQESQQRALDQLVQKLNAPPAGPTSNDLLARLDAIKSEIKSDTKEQIAAITANLTEKISGVAQTLNTFMSKSNDPATNALIALATKGNGSGGAAPDPFVGLERAMGVMVKMKTMTGMESATTPPDFPSYLVEKMAEMTPEVLNFFKERGSLPTKEEVNAQMKTAAMKMYENLDASMKQALDEGFKRLQASRGLPTAAPAPSPMPAPEVSQAPVTPGSQPGVVSFPGAAPAPTPTAAPAPTAAAQGPVTPAQLFQSLNENDRKEYAKRVNWVLNGMLSEMKLGIREMHWPEKAHGNLPKPIVEQIVEASSDTDIYNIVKPYADPTVLSQIWAYLSPSNKQSDWYQDWLASGINWIKQAEGVELVEPPSSGEDPGVEDA